MRQIDQKHLQRALATRKRKAGRRRKRGPRQRARRSIIKDFMRIRFGEIWFNVPYTFDLNSMFWMGKQKRGMDILLGRLKKVHDAKFKEVK